MKIPKKDLKIETMRGTGNGGQHKNKTDSAVRITHIPTGISAYADERSQFHSKKLAMKELERRLLKIGEDKQADNKKERRDKKVKVPQKHIRTYNFVRGTAKDHRTGKTAPLQDVLDGDLDLLK